MKKLNRNNADINEILNKKVGVVCPTEEIELDFRKWAKQYVNAVNDKYTYANCYSFCKTREDVCIFIRNDGTKWEFVECFKNSDYDIYEWEMAEEENTYTKKIKDAKPLTKEKKEILKSCLPQKAYTIKDVVENEGKIYRSTTNNCIYKYDKHNLYYKSMRKLSDDWRKTELTLGEIIELKFVEYKPEPKKITFEEAFREMEKGNVCRCLFSNRCITVYGSHFVDDSNREFTNLSLPEITGDWVVIE